MPEKVQPDLIGDYPYEEVESEFAIEFLQQMVVPEDISKAGKLLEERMCPYKDNFKYVLKANQLDIALAVREVLHLPFYPNDEELRRQSRVVLANIVKNSAEANHGTVNGERVIRLLMQYRKAKN